MKTTTNKEFANDDLQFKQACEKVDLPKHKTIIKEHGGKSRAVSGLTSLTRQASKWRMKKGKAWKEGRF